MKRISMTMTMMENTLINLAMIYELLNEAFEFTPVMSMVTFTMFTIKNSQLMILVYMFTYTMHIANMIK
jgi:hypothetical protein